MAKDAAISLRVEPVLKTALEQQAMKEGRALASYVERVLVLHSQLPNYLLRDCQPLSRKDKGPQVGLAVAEGWHGHLMQSASTAALRKVVNTGNVDVDEAVSAGEVQNVSMFNGSS